MHLDRRTALLLAYLALEGPQPRSRIAGLLWPEVPDRTARANLRQLLRRLRGAAGRELLGSGDPLALSEDVRVDAAVNGGRAAGTEAGVGARPAGRLLDGIELDEAPDLAAWLDAARGELDRRRVGASLAEARRLQEAGDLDGALAEAYRALSFDDLAEAAYREVMRLHYLAGDRAAALASFARCRVVLRERLAAEPSPETAALADEVTRGRRAPARQAPGPRAALPLSVERPPVLAGREREWARMEAAWEARRGILIGGPPGMGKTRLMRDFLAVHAGALMFRGRPGDRAVPYGTHARTYREMLEAIGGAGALPAWARRELARLIPELGDSPGPLASEEDRLRFWSAKLEAHRAAFAAGHDALGFDDLQYVDPASVEAGAYVLSRLQADPRTPIRTIHCYRTGELPAATMAHLRDLAAAGLLEHIELAPLSEAEAVDLVRGLAIPGLDAVAGPIARYAGGSPLFVLETVRHLLETGGPERGFPEKLPLPGRIGSVLQRRLELLGAPALHLARALAVLGEDFTLDLAAGITEQTGAALVELWGELEVAQIVAHGSFSHDLVAEAVAAGTPGPVRALLHRRAAEALLRAGAPAGRVAAHWLAAGDPGRAAASRRDAEAAARRMLLAHEARGYFKRAASAES